MLISSFDEWKSLKVFDLKEGNPFVECPKCEGGVAYEECNCCGHEKEWDCGTCDATGRVRFLEVEKDYTSNLDYATYFNDVVGDLKRWCAFTRANFLNEVAEFVKRERGGSHG
ncbi:MAG: hypothetical protein ACI92B_001483 [Marinobacter maritimus]|jgi:hypothetical protein